MRLPAKVAGAVYLLVTLALLVLHTVVPMTPLIVAELVAAALVAVVALSVSRHEDQLAGDQVAHADGDPWERRTGSF
ncbi:MAG: hypothetical protein QM621_01400 [Aeromicrobium sp.]|uniref:hypothetical protein n=1 Tax=Aeromicrobium sp. TaxID=1871063 RepID=UPI0039E2619F